MHSQIFNPFVFVVRPSFQKPTGEKYQTNKERRCTQSFLFSFYFFSILTSNSQPNLALGYDFLLFYMHYFLNPTGGKLKKCYLPLPFRLTNDVELYPSVDLECRETHAASQVVAVSVSHSVRHSLLSSVASSLEAPQV